MGKDFFCKKKEPDPNLVLFFSLVCSDWIRSENHTLYIRLSAWRRETSDAVFFLCLNCIMISFYHMYGESQDIFTIFYKKIRTLPETGTGILSVLRRIIKRLDRFLKVRYNGDI